MRTSAEFASSAGVRMGGARALVIVPPLLHSYPHPIVIAAAAASWLLLVGRHPRSIACTTVFWQQCKRFRGYTLRHCPPSESASSWQLPQCGGGFEMCSSMSSPGVVKSAKVVMGQAQSLLGCIVRPIGIWVGAAAGHCRHVLLAVAAGDAACHCRHVLLAVAGPRNNVSC